MRPVVAVALLAAILAACSGTTRNEVLVSAAASLADAFAEVETEFESANPRLDVVLNLGGSSALREQILAGAPVDVFASANRTNVEQVVSSGLVVGEVVDFASNRLEIAVPPDNPGSVSGLADLADPDLLVGLCAPAVPCGEYARQVLRQIGSSPSLDTNEPDVRALLTKIAAGELDVGIVYATDIAASDGAVAGIVIPEENNLTVRYPIAVIADGANPRGADAFIAFITSPAGQAIMAAHGFGAP